MKELTLNSIRDKKEKIESLNFEFTTIELEKNKFGKYDLLVSKVKLTDKDGKYIKFAQINDELLNAIKMKGIVTIKNK
jgi:hypothetical protein